MTSSSATEIVQLALRAPRVAVLFRDDANWQDWARFALQTASEIWGGAGFVLVPYDPTSGTVTAALLPLLIAYDPDHVVTTAPLISDWECLAPGVLDLGDATVEELGGHRYEDLAAATARQAVATACSPLRRPPSGLGEEESVRGRETVTHASTSPNAGGLLQIPESAPTTPCLAVAPNWRGRAALWAAVRAGAPARPDPHLRGQPDDDALYAWSVLPSVIDPPQELLRQPGLELSLPAKGRPSWFEAADPALRAFHEGSAPPTAVVVFGDAAIDFAMAMLYDRLFGYALWVPADLDLTHPARRTALDGLDYALRVIRNGGRDSHATSASLPASALQQRFEDLQTFNADAVTIDGEVVPSPRQQSLRLGNPTVRSSLQSLFLPDGLNERTSVPVLIEDRGRRVFQTGLMSPLVAPEHRAYPQESPTFPYWYVDVALDEDPAPRARDLPGSAVAVLPRMFPEAAVRRSRTGYTFHAVNPGLILAGSTVAGRLARAQLIVPTMSEWVETIADAAGMQARLSRPGQHAHLLAERLGGRGQLIDLVRTAIAMLQPFAYRDPKRFRPTLAAAHGDTLHKTEDVLTLTGIRAAAPALDLEQIRAVLDQLMSVDLLWPGLTLACRECQTVSHIRLDQLGNAYRCPRCAASNPLTHHRWDSKGNPADPAWYYDLHPIFRQLLHDHGDVPLTAAATFRSRSLTYSDVAEMEFTRRGASKPTFEIDLIARLDDRLLIVEAKSTNAFKNPGERARQLSKLLDAADLLQADRIVLATTAPGGWSATDILAARTTIEHHRGHRVLDLEPLDLSVQ